MLKVAIIGGQARERFLKPQDDVEIWCLNLITKPWLPRIDRMFNVHLFERLKEYGYDVERDHAWAQDHPETKFITADAWPSGWLVNCAGFPREAIEQYPRGKYHCGSFDWMVAYAIWMGVRQIDLHGIGLCLEAGEPISARACLEYWIGYAEGRGIKVNVAEDCDFFRFYHLVKSDLQYGYDDTPIYEDRTEGARVGAPYQL